jgi:thioesterase domain-containing protein
MFSQEEGAPSLEAVAGTHIEAMRKVRPHGPYRLGGFCNGGLLAYEMARQLQQAGEQVEFLGLIDPSPPEQFSIVRTVCQRINRAARVGARRQADLFLWARHAQRHVYRRLLPGGSRVRDFGQLLAIEPRLEAMFPPREALYQDYIGVLTWAATGYRADLYRGRISFFWARDERGISETWQPVVSRLAPADIDVHMVAGTHLSSLTDHLAQTAEVLGECMGRLDGEPGT